MRLWFVVGVICCATPILAEGLTTSLRPMANPRFASVAPNLPPTLPAASAEAPQADLAALPSSLLPKPRPAQITSLTAAVVEAKRPPGFLSGLLRPKERPDDLGETSAEIVKTAVPGKPSKVPVTSKKGSVCGDPAIKGEKISPIKSKVKGCGVPDAVRVTSVSGVRLSQAATIDCKTAAALRKWVDKSVQPAFGNKLVELQVAAHYICRPRNNVKGNKISEHGRGKAVDISGFTLSDGTTLTVARNYNKTLRKVHKAACGTFSTTLGPGSDGFHEDHFHFDTASHRSGTYCR